MKFAEFTCAIPIMRTLYHRCNQINACNAATTSNSPLASVTFFCSAPDFQTSTPGPDFIYNRILIYYLLGQVRIDRN